MIRQNELMNVRCSERGSLLGIKIYSPSSECLIECVDIPEHKAYLLSLRHFCLYATSEKPECADVDTALASQIAEKARLWSMLYKKDSTRRHLEKMNKDLSNLVTPDMINEFEQSESAGSTIRQRGKLTGAHSLVVNQAMYTLFGDFPLLEITIEMHTNLVC